MCKVQLQLKHACFRKSEEQSIIIGGLYVRVAYNVRIDSCS